MSRLRAGVCGGMWECAPGKVGGREPGGDEAVCGVFDIDFTAGDRAREASMRRRFQAELPVEQFRRADEAVAVEAAQPRELGLLQAGDGAEQADQIGRASCRERVCQYV